MRHSAAHVMAEAVSEPLPGHEARLRPADRGRLLLRLRPAAAADRGGLPGHRGRDAADREGQGALPAHGHEHRRRARLLRRARATRSRSTRSTSWSARARRRSRSTASATSSTSAAGRTCRTPGASAPSRCCRWPAPTGAASEQNPQLTRVYATAFPKRGRARRSTSSASRRPGRATTAGSAARARASSTSTTPAPGSRSSSRRGWSIVNRIQPPCGGSWRALDYDEIRTPTILSDELWHEQRPLRPLQGATCTSPGSTSQEFAVKPMNCPGAAWSTAARRRSYRDLPLRLAEFGHVHRHELSGVLHGLLPGAGLHAGRRPRLLRARPGARRGGGHPRPDRALLRALRLRGRGALQLATRPEKATGTTEMWDAAEAALRGRPRGPRATG